MITKNKIDKMFDGCELHDSVLNEIIMSQMEYFDALKNELTKAFPTNGTVSLNVADLKSSIKTGLTLWNQIVKKARTEYNSRDGEGRGKAMIFKAEQNGDNDYKFFVYNSVNKFKKSYRLRRSEKYKVLLESYAWFSNRDENCSENANKRFYAFTGEVAILQKYGTEKLIEGISGLSKCDGMNFIAGPTVVADNDDRVNKFIYEQVKFWKSSLKLYKNLIFPITKLCAGGFHYYVAGDNIFAEKPHEFGNYGRADNYWVVFNDRELAEELREFSDNYVSRFAKELNPTDLLKGDLIKNLREAFVAIDTRKVRLSKKSLLAHLDRSIAGQ